MSQLLGIDLGISPVVGCNATCPSERPAGASTRATNSGSERVVGYRPGGQRWLVLGHQIDGKAVVYPHRRTDEILAFPPGRGHARGDIAEFTLA